VQLTRLRLFQYRNIAELEIFPSGRTSLFSGRNGQGKTNLLEAVYFLGYGRSFRTATPRDCIQHGRAEARIEGTVAHESRSRELAVTIAGNQKRLFLLGKPVPLEAFVGTLQILVFAHEHLKVVRGAPADRRAFLDRAMAVLYPGHMRALAAYGRALRQRNALLSAARGDPAEGALLESWDEALVREGARILHNRFRYVKGMRDCLAPSLFGSEVLEIDYRSSLADPSQTVPEIEEAFRRRLLELRPQDSRAGFTTAGPHRDDLDIRIDGKSLVDFGSAGQQRSGLLALYFSQMEIHRRVHGFYPVFLVDDAEAELDELRLQSFLGYLADRTQTFLTSAKGYFLSSAPRGAELFQVCDGSVSGPSATSI